MGQMAIEIVQIIHDFDCPMKIYFWTQFDNKISFLEQFCHFPVWLLFVASKALEAWCEAQICENDFFFVILLRKMMGNILSHMNTCK